MAIIEFQIDAEEEHNRPASVERIEVRAWARAGLSNQVFVIGSGLNFDASIMIPLEIIYTVNEVQFFYTRTFLHVDEMITDHPYMEYQCRLFEQGKDDHCWLVGMLPETSIHLSRTKYQYPSLNNGEMVTGESFHLEVKADTGAVMGHRSPGERFIALEFSQIPMQMGVQFIRELGREIDAALQGAHPNPADLPEGASDWEFLRRLNQKAYDHISEEYLESYFSNPNLTTRFDEWLSMLLPGGHVLDAGCGHGDPVIARLLEKGFRVTGTDLSPRMLARASERFPGVEFRRQLVSDIREEALYDGACSFSSLLYLDPIDLAHSLYRLFRAVKPGGLVFLFGYDLDPSGRGQPYEVQIGQWMWSWTYGIEEVRTSLQEFGWFEVLHAGDVSTDEEREERIERWRKRTKEDYEKFVKSLPEGVESRAPDLNRVPANLPYKYVVIARRAVG